MVIKPPHSDPSNDGLLWETGDVCMEGLKNPTDDTFVPWERPLPAPPGADSSNNPLSVAVQCSRISGKCYLKYDNFTYIELEIEYVFLPAAHRPGTNLISDFTAFPLVWFAPSISC